MIFNTHITFKFADPIQGVRIVGQQAKVYYETAQYNMNESMENL
jgi:hypothetical protein